MDPLLRKVDCVQIPVCYEVEPQIERPDSETDFLVDSAEAAVRRGGWWD